MNGSSEAPSPHPGTSIGGCFQKPLKEPSINNRLRLQRFRGSLTTQSSAQHVFLIVSTSIQAAQILLISKFITIGNRTTKSIKQEKEIGKKEAGSKNNMN